MSDDSKARAERFAELKRTVAAEIGRSTDDARTIQISTLKLQSETLQARLVAGEVVQTSELITLAQTITELTPEPPITVSVHYIGPEDPLCPHCGKRASEPAQPVVSSSLPPPEQPRISGPAKANAQPSEKPKPEPEILPPKPKLDYFKPVDHTASPHFPGRADEPWRSANFNTRSYPGDHPGY